MTADRSVTIRLRVSSAEFDAAMARAGISVEALAAEVRAAGDEASTSGGKLGDLGQKAKQADSGMGALLRTAIILTPALIPIAGAAIAGGAALGALGITGVLAFKGVSKEMKDGTDVGKAYSAGVSTIKGNLGQLESVAAGGVLTGFDRSVQSVDRRMPQLITQTRILSGELGDIASHSIDAVVGGYTAFGPLLQHTAMYGDQAATAFDKWANGPGGEHFAVALGNALDQAVPAVEAIAGAGAHVVSAFAPVGGFVLHDLELLSKVIEGIPLPILQGLAFTLVGFNSAKAVAGIFDSIGGKIRTMGEEGALANTRLSGLSTGVGTFASKAGLLVGIGLAAWQAGAAIGKMLAANDSLNASIDHSGSAYSSFYNAIVTSNGAIGDGVRQAAAYQLQADKITDKAARAGISQGQLTSAVTGSDEQYQKLIETWRASGKPADDTIKALDMIRAQYGKAYGPAEDYLTIQRQLAKTPAWAALQTTADSLQQVADQYGLTVDQAGAYAKVAGLTVDQISNGEAKNKDLAAAIHTVSGAYSTATATGAGFLAVLQTFSQSAGTAADRAALIGATLKAANGDSLAYASAVNNAAVANAGLVSSVKDAASQVGKSGISTKAFLASVIDLRTGTIDYTNAAAAPLISGLQQIQDAGMAAAQATFQHERATMGAKAAADDAYQVYVGQTRGQLIDEATKLGLTSVQAKRLADHYLGMPKNVKTKIEQEGADPVLTVLTSINRTLLAIAHMSPHPTISVHDDASAKIAKVKQNILALQDHTIDITTYLHNVILPTVRTESGSHDSHHNAAGTGPGGLPDGVSTVGEAGFEVVEKHGSRVDVYSNRDSQKMLGVSKIPGYADGTVKPHTVIDREGTAIGIAEMIHRHTPAAVAAMHDLSDAVSAAFKLHGVSAELEAARAKLGQLRQSEISLRGDVAQALRGGLNPAQLGGDLTKILAKFGGGTDAANAFTKKIDTLSGRGLSKDYLEDLARNGQGATLDALTAASQSQLAEVSKAFTKYEAATAKAGQVAGADVYGSAIMAQHKHVDSLLAAQRRQEATIDRLVHAVRLLTNRPVQVKLDGRVLVGRV